MAVYYLGNPAEKRRKLIENKDGIYLDNDEVLASYGKGSKYYFIVGKAPFADFTVWEYLSYTKSLELRRPLKLEEAKTFLARTGLNVKLNKRLNKLCPITLKAVKLATLLRADSAKIYFNFDGLVYSKRNYCMMQRLLAALNCFETIVSVSDVRFVPQGGAIMWFLGKDECARKAKIKKQGRQATRISVEA